MRRIWRAICSENGRFAIILVVIIGGSILPATNCLGPDDACSPRTHGLC